MTLQEMINHWIKWLEDNPEAESHQRSYANGVIDGLRYAINPVQFIQPGTERKTK